MELPISQEAEIPVPINSTYGHGHIIHHQHRHDHLSPHHHHISIPPSSSSAPSNGTATIHPQGDEEEEEEEEDRVQANYKKQQQQVVVKYRECLKNHAAAMGGNAIDGCGEFMPSGEEGTIEALTCSACNCHRNFHRREIEGEPSASSSCDCYHLINRGGGRKIINLAHHNNKGILPPGAFGYPTSGGTLIPAARSVPIMPYNNMGFLPSESDEQEDGCGIISRGPLQMAAPLQASAPLHHHHHHQHQGVKKRFRTKFTQEQKEKMLNFAEKVGWKIQKQEEGVVQQFCQEIGVKRRVLKVWMHNNKHNLAKKNFSSTNDA
ncbi:hypothetical protein Ancab_003273 [Ancistrocladus abbreviatus]